MKKVICITLILAVIGSSFSMVFADENTYDEKLNKETTTIKPEKSSWYYEDFKEFINNGYIEETLKPEEYISYSKMVEMLSKIFNFNDDIKIIDITGHEYSSEQKNHTSHNNVLKLTTNGFYKPFNKEYSYDSKLSKEEFAKYIISFINYHYKYPEIETNEYKEFLLKNGIVKENENYFNGEKNITNAEAIVVLRRAMKYLEDEKNKLKGLFNELDEDKNIDFTLLQNNPVEVEEFIEIFKYATYGDRPKKYVPFIYEKESRNDSIRNLFKAYEYVYQSFQDFSYYKDKLRLNEYRATEKDKGRIKGKNYFDIKILVNDHGKDFEKINPTQKLQYEKIFYNELKFIVKDLINKKIITEEMTNLQKAEFVADWILERVKFDDDYKDNQISFTGYGALINKKAVCQGYVILYDQMLRMLNVESKTISGSATSAEKFTHTWNEITVNDSETYYVDLTWIKTSGEYDKFFTSNKKSFQTTHKWKEDFFNREF